MANRKCHCCRPFFFGSHFGRHDVSDYLLRINRLIYFFLFFFDNFIFYLFYFLFTFFFEIEGVMRGRP